MEMPDASSEGSSPAGSLWTVLACSAVGIAVAVVPCASLIAQQGPTWLAVGAGLAVFPVLPLVWHFMAEAKRVDRGRTSSASHARFGLRSLAIALLVFLVSLAAQGPQRVLRNLGDLVGHVRVQPTAKPQVTPPPTRTISQAGLAGGLESFIPADATLAVELAGSGAMERLLTAYGIDSRNQLAALATCRIDLGNARVLIAMRGKETRMIVVRAPGITDERNLYCLVGILGRDRLQLRSEGTGADTTLFVNGILSRQLVFRLLDSSTVIATDEDWQDTADKRLFQPGGTTVQGHLAPALARLNRAATVWIAGVETTPQGDWDVALDGRQEGNLFKFQGSAVPPSGDADRAELSLRVPLAFALALPEGAVAKGVRGMVAALAAASVPLVQALPGPLPRPPVPVVAPDAGGPPKSDRAKAP